MKRKIWVNILREIRDGRSRFLSILAIVGIGVGFFGGVKAAGPDMRQSADRYYRESRLMDFRLVSTAGFTQEDVRLLGEMDGTEVAAGWFLDCLTERGGVEQAVRVASLEDTQQINRIELLSGRMPETPKECLADGSRMGGSTAEGTVFRLFGEDDSIDDMLACTEYTVVGTFRSPLYIDGSARGSTTVGDGSISEVLLLPAENFKPDVYTQLYLRIEELARYPAYSAEYERARERWVDALEQQSDGRTAVRLRELQQQIAEAISDGEEELSDGEAELREARQKLADAEAELADAKEQLADGEKELADARRQLDDGWRQWRDGKAQLENEINAGRAKYEAGEREYREQKAQLDQSVQQAAATLRQIDTAPLRSALTQLADALDEGMDADQVRELIIQNAPTEQSRTLLLQLADAALSDAEASAAAASAARQLAAVPVEPADLAAELEKLTDDSDPAANMAAAGQLRDALHRLEEILDAETRSLLSPLDQLIDGYVLLMQGRQQLDAASEALRTGYAQGAALVEEGKAELEAGEKEYAKGKKKLEDARQQYEDGLAEYQKQLPDAQKKLTDGEKQLTEGRAQLADARQQLRELGRPSWYIFDREDNPGYTEYGQNAQRIENIARIFPVLFLLVAALVSLTTMERMVEEQRTQIGSLKALGYGSGILLTKYMVYALSATVIGSFLGLIIGFKLFPGVIIFSYGILYNIPVMEMPFRWSLALGASGAATACIAATVYFSCRSAFRQQPAQLMRPRAPAQGKKILLERIPFLWKRFNFSQKVSARNIFRYKKRMLMAIIGISGCTALVVTGFALKDSISDIAVNQFESIWSYSATAAFEEKNAAAAREELLCTLTETDERADVLLTVQKTYNGVTENGRCEVTVMVPEDYARLPQFVDLRDRRSGEKVRVGEDEIVITEKMATLLQVGVGDTVTLQNDSGFAVGFTVGGIAENYISHFAYMSAESYRRLFGEEPAWNTALCRYAPLAQPEESALAARLLAQPDVLYVSLISTTAGGVGDMLRILDLVVVVLIVSAGALAFVVLYNLTNINITERIREIATLKVLGFNDREVSAYIFRENLVLTLLGAAAGLLLGRWMAMTVITTAEIDVVMFGREISALSYGYAFGITALFSVLVSLFMHRGLREISMVESLKSVE